MACEGYVNYATFGVAVTLENDREMARKLRGLVELAREQAPNDENVLAQLWTVEQTERIRLAEAVKDWVERLAEAGSPTLIQTQLIAAGLSEVDWNDLAAVELARES